MTDDLNKQLKLANTRALRLKSARDQSEALLEQKSRELYAANTELEKAQKSLEFDIKQATYELSVSNKRLQKALNERSTFIGKMSHEVRTPLNAIEGLSEILLDTNLDATQLDYVDTINSAARSLTVLIEDLLDITKIEAGKIKIMSAPVDSERLYRNVVSMFAIEAKEKDLKLELELCDNLPTTLVLDKGRYKQILSNLISNAIRNTDHGEVVVKTAFELNQKSNAKNNSKSEIEKSGTLTVSVQDSGVGIESKQLKNIFNAYAQLGNSSEGVGLGLAICSQLSKLMKGELSCDSIVGQGSNFQLTIPVIVSDESCIDSKTAIIKNVSSQQQLKILVAEDNPVNQKVIAAQLAQFEQKADIVSNGAEAISKLRSQSYDVVFLDILMPVMNGEEALLAIRNSDTRISEHYCVALTASNFQGQKEKLLKLGFNDFLSKPLSLENLSKVLDFVSQTVHSELNDHDLIKMKSSAREIDEFDLTFLTEQFSEAAGDIFMEIAPTFLTHTKNDLYLLKKAIEQERTESINKISHSIKGASLSLGLTEFAELLSGIEQEPQGLSVHELHSRVEESWSVISSQISALIESLKLESSNA